MGSVVLSELRQAYGGRRVLVTGDTGFKGSWLCLALTELGAHVYGFALPCQHDSDHFNVAGLSDLVDHRDGDLRTPSALSRRFDETTPEVVFHLAAQPLVRLSYADPKATFDTNIGGSVTVLEEVRRASSVRALVYITSDKCYRNKEWPWGYRENDELGGSDPYSASKAAAELVFAAYLESFFRARPNFGAASARAGNVIGGGDWSADRIVPDCVRALLESRPITLRNPNATRPWQHVLEPVFAYLLLGARLLTTGMGASGAWNFGPLPERSHTVHELAEEVVRLWGSGVVRVEQEALAPREHGLLQLNCDKARMALDWQARWPVTRAVRETITWYRRVCVEKEDALAVSRQQIQDYLETASD